jgi:prepilin-type processing-associated H-X9-DG protein
LICEFKIIISWLFQKCRNAEMQKCRNAEMQKCRNAEMQKCRNAEKGKSKSKSFTLVEIVFTISIIGILLAILLPAMSAIKLSAKKVKDISNLKRIAEAWRECAINRGWVIDGREDGSGTPKVSVFIEQLAGRGRTNISDMVFNDPYAYISQGDKYISKVVNSSLCRVENGKILFTGVGKVTNFMVSNSCMLSYCLVMGLSASVPLETTPLGFTRGLREDGKWDEKAGPYGSKGGYVVYCDGHVTWLDGDRPAKFLKWDQLGYVTDIREAVPSSAWITCGNEGTKTNYMSDGSLVILYHAGTGGE